MAAKYSLISTLDKLKGMVLLNDVGDEYEMEFINERAQPTLIHTCFMAFPIDITVYGEHGEILEEITNMKPWRFRFIAQKVSRMVERRSEAQVIG